MAQAATSRRACRLLVARLLQREILAIVKRPFFRCKSGEGANPYRVFWRQMDS